MSEDNEIQDEDGIEDFDEDFVNLLSRLISRMHNELLCDPDVKETTAILHQRTCKCKGDMDMCECDPYTISIRKGERVPTVQEVMDALDERNFDYATRRGAWVRV